MSRPVPTLPPQFAKLAALALSSTFEAERDTARRKAEAILPPEAGGFERALRIQAYHDVMEKGRGNTFAGFDEFHEIDNPGHMAAEAAKRAEKRRQQDARRAELMAEFGSFEAVLKPCAREKALLAAVKPWRVAQPGTRGRWTKSLAGLGYNERRQGAARDRHRDRGCVSDAGHLRPGGGRDGLLGSPERRHGAGEPVRLHRRRHARSALRVALPAGSRPRRARMELRTLPEIIARMRVYRWNEFGTDTDVEDAILRDLDALVAQEAT